MLIDVAKSIPNSPDNNDLRLAISDQRFSISLVLGNTRVPDPFRGLRGVGGEDVNRRCEVDSQFFPDKPDLRLAIRDLRF